MNPQEAKEFEWVVRVSFIFFACLMTWAWFATWWSIKTRQFIVTYPKSDRRISFCLGLFGALFAIAMVISMEAAGVVFLIGCLSTLLVMFITKED